MNRELNKMKDITLSGKEFSRENSKCKGPGTEMSVRWLAHQEGQCSQQA